jgi:FAD synthetase
VLSHSLEEISISYNGGKDCLVLLVLFLAALATHPGPLPTSLQSVYIISPHPFAEVDSFVDESQSDYRLGLARYAMPMKEAFEQYLADKPKVKAIFVGTRRTDPHGALLTHFDMTNQGWPLFMRIHPVIDWHYVEIWTVSHPTKMASI